MCWVIWSSGMDTVPLRHNLLLFIFCHLIFVLNIFLI